MTRDAGEPSRDTSGARFPLSLQRWWSIVLKEFLQLRRDRVTFGMIVGLPIVQLKVSLQAFTAEVNGFGVDRHGPYLQWFGPWQLRRRARGKFQHRTRRCPRPQNRT